MLPECKISIIVPVYNAELYLNECIKSLLIQDIEEYEIICIDDGSTDCSAKIIEEFQRSSTLIKLVNQENQGLSIARNNGIEHARGEFILFVDSDDYIEKNVLGRLYNLCKQNDLQILDFKTYVLNNGIKKVMYSNQVDAACVVDGISYLSDYILRFKKQPFLSAWAHVYRREFLIESKIIFEENRLYEDLLFTFTAYSVANRVMYLNMPVYNYRKSKDSITSSLIKPKNIVDLQFTAVEISKYSKEIGIKIPMDNFFSGIRNQIIISIKAGLWKEHRTFFNKKIFRETDFYLYNPLNRAVYPFAKKSYTFFVIYSFMVFYINQLRHMARSK